MTTAVAASGSTSQVRRVALAFVIIAGAVAVAALAGSNDARPYDLQSTDPDGLAGLRLILEAHESSVEDVAADGIDAAAADRFGAVFIPVAENASPEQVARWRGYVHAGGRLILGSTVDGLGIAPPAEDESAPLALDLMVIGRESGYCTMDGLAGLDIELGPSTSYLPTTGAQESCFGQMDRAVITRTADGVVNLGSPHLFDNSLMGQPERGSTEPKASDNPVVAMTLMVPEEPTRVAVVTRGLSLARSGPVSLFDFVRPGIRAGLWEAVVAVAFFAWWRGRRHGRVVREPAPTEIAASELVDAVGNLLERQGDAANAIRLQRAAVGRELAVRLGVPVASDPHAVARLVSARTGRPLDEIVALFKGPVDDDAALLDMSARLESVRQEVLHV